MLNAGLGFIMPIVLSVFGIINMSSIQGFFVNTTDFLTPFVCVATVVVCSMGYMSACTVSLEGGAFWIIKSMPISARTLILGKVLPQIIISVPVQIITGICLSFAAGIAPIYCVLVVLVGIVMAVAFAFLGIVMNILFPRFDYVSEAHVVKQSLAATLTLFSQMAIGIALVPLAIWFIHLQLSAFISLALMLSVAALLAITFAVIALIPCASKVEKMSI